MRNDREPVLSRAVNIACTGLVLVFLFPAFCTVALAIKLNDSGPVFYSQQRVGKNFRLFRLLKFRTMRMGADSCGSLTRASDERITRIGRFLRKYKLDELPQLINILKGDMQLVGPRPEVECYVEMFRPQFEILLQEAPGLTDPASLAYIDESSKFSNPEQIENQYVSEILPDKLRLSLEYQQRRTFFSDVRVILQTLTRLFSSAPTTAPAPAPHSYN